MANPLPVATYPLPLSSFVACTERQTDPVVAGGWGDGHNAFHAIAHQADTVKTTEAFPDDEED